MWKSNSKVLANCTSGHPKKIHLPFPVFPEFLGIPDTIMGSEPTNLRGSDLLNQYSDIICCYGLEDESIAQHEKAGHYPKMRGCSVCETAFAQRCGAHKGGLYKKSRSETMNIDLIDWGKADFMGLRYTCGGAITNTCFAVTRTTATKRGPVVAYALQDMIAYLIRTTLMVTTLSGCTVTKAVSSSHS